jgi:hypothetical protein
MVAKKRYRTEVLRHDSTAPEQAQEAKQPKNPINPYRPI